MLDKLHLSNSAVVLREHYTLCQAELNENLKKKIDTIKYLYTKEVDDKIFKKIKAEEEHVKANIALQKSTDMYIEALAGEIIKLQQELQKYKKSAEYWHNECLREQQEHIEFIQLIIDKNSR